MKLDREFEAFGSGKNKQEKEEENVVLRGNKPSVDRTRERRSWGNVEVTCERERIICICTMFRDN